MSKIYAKDVAVGTTIKSHFCVIDKRLVNYSRNGAPACGVVMTVGDKTGKVSAVVWNEALVADNSYRKDDIVLLVGRVQDYRGDKQIYIEEISKANLADVNAEDFCAAPPRPIEEMWQELQEIVVTVSNPFLRALLDLYLSSENAPAFKQAPAGRDVHHAYAGGLLHHTLEVVAYAQTMVDVQGARLNRDLLITGAILHDHAKTQEYEPKAFSFEFTDRGRLLGHLVLGAENVGKLTDKIPGFPGQLRDELQHMILSHHGTREWGSPEEPKTAAALALHLADLTSSRLSQVEKIIDDTLSLGERWSAWDRRLERNFLAVTWGDVPNDQT
ncbi:MAG: HD domain-containing protein [Bacillota bacterium]|nr:HD domain-containing protein [Bacillota bacterium]